MNRRPEPWVIVLAAGAGTRLASLTVGDDGVVVPKQYCSLRGGRSLLLDTVDRALQLTGRERVVAVVAAEHERWWRPQLACLAPGNVVVQPHNRGTTAGILLPLAHVLARDPQAQVAVLPSDHHVDEPAVLTAAMRAALGRVAGGEDRLVLLGITPDGPDTEYGWILPRGATGGLQEVDVFVEKPPAARAATLWGQGAVWNSFLFAGTATGIWRLAAHEAPQTAASITAVVHGPIERYRTALQALYAELPIVDFSAVVLGRSPRELALLRVPPCGWTDLGTPPRVAECLRRLAVRAAPHRPQWYPTVDLATATRRASVASACALATA